MAEPISILKLRRSQPQAGKSVTVHVEDITGNNYGMLLLPFEVWIKLKKLLEAGQDSNARLDYPIQLKVVIEGFVTETQKKKTQEYSARTLRPGPQLKEDSIEDPEAVAQMFLDESTVEDTASGVVQQLVRTLKEGPENE